MKNKIVLVAFFIIATACAQDRFSKVKITTTKVTEDIYMLQGAGGNIGICTGEDGVFMVDDQFAPLSEKIQAAIASVSSKPVTFLMNTHFHGDHTGGNANFEAKGTMIVAQENVRKRLAENKTKGLPVITFSDDATFYMNGNDIFLTHVHNAHTDGDTLVYFVQSNVLHTGDTFFNGLFPFIDIKRGGSLDGDIAAAKKGLLITNDNSKIIPGHGPLATRAAYLAYHDMLVDIRSNITLAIKNGKTEEQVTKMESLTSKWYTDAQTEGQFITGEKMRRTAYQSILSSMKIKKH